VLLDAQAPRPAEFIFGSEPAHTWCYYYQKAELALQRGDWTTVIQIGKKVTQLDLSPEDKIEWAPFLQAYALNGDEQGFNMTVAKIEKTPFVRQEVCQTLLKMNKMGSRFTTQIQLIIDTEVCDDQAELN
jgi:hypothetical protein